LVSLPHIEAIARTRLSEAAYGFISGGGANENTLHWNREAFDRMRLRPRILVDVAKIDTRVTLFGEQLPFPLLLAPTGRHRAIHREGELGTAKGAGAARTVMTVSTMATTAVEDIAKVASSPLWFQLYILGDRSFTRDLVQRAENAGCKAICVTVDTAGSGARDRETRANFRNPPGVDQPHVRGLKRVAMDPSMTWKDIEWLRSFARVPVLLKGVLNPSDAEQAAREGVAGIIVSNHGGRQLDTVPATIDALPEIVEKVGGRAPVLLDGGIRRGTDILKALALGAQAVLVGRPYLYGLGVAGAEGVTRVIDILRTELQWAMALTGKTSIASIDRSVLWSAPMRS
jgi:4-hydroxymandelate oxidase